ncbi:HAMP domain-containing sensor histidine kinase [Microvirga sp. W0021]|uniref:histidine kinase n=1 Tax=Hohaiivirga grylli TaxID=3133970 RepID=A0ABV0BF85_9HYPH
MFGQETLNLADAIARKSGNDALQVFIESDLLQKEFGSHISSSIISGACPAITQVPSNERFAPSKGECIHIVIEFPPLSLFDFLSPLGRPVFAATFMSLLSALWLARYFLQPLEILKTGLKSLAKGNFNTRISGMIGKRSDEIATVAHDFDQSASKLEILNQSQKRLFHDISHELRSPLSRLRAATGVLEKNTSRLPIMLERINRECNRLDSLVGEILTLAQLETDQPQSLEKQRVDIIELIAAIVSDASFEGQAKNISIQFDASKSIMAQVNEELLTRAIENVIRNSIKFCDAGGHIEIVTSLSPDKQNLNIRIKDDGPGLDESELETIFKPFTKSGNSIDKQGAGLGLSIAQRAIELHEGQITADSYDSHGLIIAINLPLQPFAA